MFTQDTLNELKQAYASGVLKVREGETWFEYQSMAQMAEAIDRIEAYLQRQAMNISKPRGARFVKISKSEY